MKNFISTFLFLFLIFIIQFSFYNNQNRDFALYYTGGPETDNDSSGNTNDNENTCICDIDRNSCDYLCCCDTTCPNEAIEDWRKHLKCIDEKDSLGIFADRCIDIHLLIKNNSRRGLKIDKQTEDILNSDKTIENFCYSMDNSDKMKKDIISLNNLGKEEYKEYKEFNIIKEQIYDQYIKKIILKNFEDNNNDSGQGYEDDKNYITIKERNKIFALDEKFSLLSGSNCQTLNKVEIFKPESYSCYKKERIDSFDGISIRGVVCSIKYYELNSEGLLTSNTLDTCGDKHRIREVEFVLALNEQKSCLINSVCEYNENENEGYIFKNSVIFSKDTHIPYRYSGQGGYLLNFPLKICNDTHVFNEFYIIGRKKNGDCREDIEDEKNINYYLYDFDVPFSFGKDYVYSCKYKDNPSNTILLKKIKSIKKIAKYGSSSYKNTDNETEWLRTDIDLSSIEKDIGEKNAYIDMKVYIRTKKIGLYSHKYIYSVNFETSTDGNNKILQFRIKYYDLNGDNGSENIYSKKPDYPSFLPKIPGDLLDPMIYSDVDK